MFITQARGPNTRTRDRRGGIMYAYPVRRFLVVRFVCYYYFLPRQQYRYRIHDTLPRVQCARRRRRPSVQRRHKRQPDTHTHTMTRTLTHTRASGHNGPRSLRGGVKSVFPPRPSRVSDDDGGSCVVFITNATRRRQKKKNVCTYTFMNIYIYERIRREKCEKKI